MSYPEPKYFGDGEVSAVLRRGPALQPVDGQGWHAGPLPRHRTATKGEFGLYRWDFTGPPSGPDPHFHKTVLESFYMLPRDDSAAL
jgi:hypothetical protein